MEGRILMLVLLFAGGATAATPYGVQVSPATYRANLLYIKQQVLPVGWQLNPVQKWDAYGHGIRQVAGEAMKLGMPVSVLTNQEAAEALAAGRAAGVKHPVVRRIMPADGPARAEVLQAAKQRLGIEELMAPSNWKHIVAAAAATRTIIPVHIFLFNHYENAYGFNFTTTQQLEQFVKGLDPRLVKVRGIMMHTGGDTPAEAAATVARFNKVACPVAQALATPTSPVYLHFASSSDIERLVPEAGGRMVAPADLCKGPGVMWAARIGSVTYGGDKEDNDLLRHGTAPVMTWMAPVTAIKVVKRQDGSVRKLAQVQVAPSRYPAPTWFADVQAFIPESPDTSAKTASTKPQASAAAGSYQPDSYVLINGQTFRLATIPKDGSQLLVDVTAAKRPITAGASVCILCEDRPLGALSAEIGTDDYNAALCLTGRPRWLGPHSTPLSAEHRSLRLFDRAIHGHHAVHSFTDVSQPNSLGLLC